jgi:hypothetical protein
MVIMGSIMGRYWSPCIQRVPNRYTYGSVHGIWIPSTLHKVHIRGTPYGYLLSTYSDPITYPIITPLVTKVVFTKYAS